MSVCVCVRECVCVCVCVHVCVYPGDGNAAFKATANPFLLSKIWLNQNRYPSFFMYILLSTVLFGGHLLVPC